MNTKIVRTPGTISNRRESKREKIDHEHKVSTNTWMDLTQERKCVRERERKRDIMNTQIERTPGTVRRRDVGREQDIL